MRFLMLTIGASWYNFRIEQTARYMYALLDMSVVSAYDACRAFGRDACR